jgi:polysaccharide export outer membrane protein
MHFSHDWSSPKTGLFALGLMVILAAAGCSTLDKLGLPISSGPHKLLKTANRLRKSSGHAGDFPCELAKTVQSSHHVEPGDVLVVEPIDFDSPLRFPPDQVVQADGTIDLGQFGRLPVAGLTLEEIRETVDAMVAPSVSLQPSEETRRLPAPDEAEVPLHPASVSVRLVSNESAFVYVLGEVNAPGAYPLSGRETVLDAIINAGGLTEQANEHKMILTRPRQAEEKPTVLPICFRQIVQLGDTSTNYQIFPGDRVYIPSMTILDDIKQTCDFGEGSCRNCRDYRK